MYRCYKSYGAYHMACLRGGKFDEHAKYKLLALEAL